MTTSYVTQPDGLPGILKTADAVLDYSWNFAPWLAQISDEIDDFVVTASPEGITLDSSLRAGAIVVAWVSGGQAGQEYKLTCRITTASTPSRIDSRTIKVMVVAER